MFRGSELPRLLLLLAIVVVGWPLACRQVASRPAAGPGPAPAPPRSAAEVPPLPPPDTSEALRAVQDKTEISYREDLAYAELLRRARSTTAADLAAKGLRHVSYADLIDRPARYRGLPIHLEGTALRVSVHDEVRANLTPSRRLYQADIVTSESHNYPYLLIFDDAPPGLPAGGNLHERVSFDGYFFKLLLYRDGAHVLRFAPLLVGRLSYRPAAKADEGPGPLTLPRSMGEVRWPFVLLGALALYAAVRLVFVLRRSFAPVPRPSPRIRPVEEIDPDALASWLNDAPDDGGPAPGLSNGKKDHRPEDDDWRA
jgi:hypothetical protein